MSFDIMHIMSNTQSQGLEIGKNTLPLTIEKKYAVGGGSVLDKLKTRD